MSKQKKLKFSPHDILFKSIMGRKKVIIDFINTFLPEIAPYLNFDTLKILNQSFISEELKEQLVDLIAEIETRSQKALIIFLYEHKSFKDKYLYFQLFEYELAIIKYYRSQKQPIPIIIPIVFYHGKEKFEFPNFKELYGEIEEIFYSYIPKLKVVFFDIHTYGEEYIKKAEEHFELALLIGLLYNIFKEPEDMLQFLEDFANKHKDHIRTERDIIKAALIYLSTFSKFEIPTYRKRIMQAFDYDIEITYEKGSYFDKLLTKEREKGLQQGLQQGLKLGYRERALKIARRMLEKGYTLEQVIDLVELSDEEIEILKQELDNK